MTVAKPDGTVLYHRDFSSSSRLFARNSVIVELLPLVRNFGLVVNPVEMQCVINTGSPVSVNACPLLQSSEPCDGCCQEVDALRVIDLTFRSNDPEIERLIDSFLHPIRAELDSLEDHFRLILHSVLLASNLHAVPSQLNGNNGEATNTDDMPRKNRTQVNRARRQGQPKRRQPARNQPVRRRPVRNRPPPRPRWRRTPNTRADPKNPSAPASNSMRGKRLSELLQGQREFLSELESTTRTNAGLVGNEMEALPYRFKGKLTGAQRIALACMSPLSTELTELPVIPGGLLNTVPAAPNCSFETRNAPVAQSSVSVPINTSEVVMFHHPLMHTIELLNVDLNALSTETYSFESSGTKEGQVAGTPATYITVGEQPVAFKGSPFVGLSSNVTGSPQYIPHDRDAEDAVIFPFYQTVSAGSGQMGVKVNFTGQLAASAENFDGAAGPTYDHTIIGMDVSWSVDKKEYVTVGRTTSAALTPGATLNLTVDTTSNAASLPPPSDVSFVLWRITLWLQSLTDSSAPVEGPNYIISPILTIGINAAGMSGPTPVEIWATKPIKSLLDQLPNYTSCAAIGTTAMLSPRTPVIGRGGTAWSYRFKPGEAWYSYLSDPSSYAENVGVTEMDFEKGIMRWLKAANENWLEYAQDFKRDASGNLIRYCAPFDVPQGGFICTAFLPPSTSGSYAANSVRLRTEQSLAATVTSQSLPSLVPNVFVPDIIKATKFLNSMPEVFENPTHLSEIAESVFNWWKKSTAKAAEKLPELIGYAV